MSREVKLHLFALLGIIGVSWSAPLVKLALNLGAHPVSIALWRLLFSTLLLTPFVFFRGRNRCALKTLPPKTILFLVAAGVLLALHFLFWFVSLSLTTAFVSTVTLCIQPLVTLLLAYAIWREVPSRGSLPGILIAMAGAFVLSVSFMGEPNKLSGMSYAVLGALALTGYFLCNKALRNRLPLTVHTFLVYGICTVVVLCIALISGSALYTPTLPFFLLCLLLALVSTLCGHSVFNYLLKYRPAGAVAALQLGEPVGAAIIAYFLLSEVPSFTATFGGVLILLGILMFILRENHASSK